MAQGERHRKLSMWLHQGGCGRDRALRELEISRSTLQRDIAYLRDRLCMPIEWVPERGAWMLRRDAGQQYELPSLSFGADEVHALLLMQHLLSNLEPGGLLGPHIEPLRRKLHGMLGSGAAPAAEIARRIHVRTVGARRIEVPHFQAVGSALLRRRRLVLHYRARGAADDGHEPLPAEAPREVSPQRLVNHRSNWYLQAWCHTRGALRSFSVDAIERVQVLVAAAIEMREADLDALLDTGYGIFAGRDVQWARLRFSVECSRWVAAERWHQDQRGWFDEGGCWTLDLPYSDMRELALDVMRHVPEVQVLWPESLADEIERRLRQAVADLDAG